MNGSEVDCGCPKRLHLTYPGDIGTVNWKEEARKCLYLVYHFELAMSTTNLFKRWDLNPQPLNYKLSALTYWATSIWPNLGAGSLCTGVLLTSSQKEY